MIIHFENLRSLQRLTPEGYGLLTRLRPLGHEIIIKASCKKKYIPFLMDQIDASQLRYFDCHGT